MKNLSNSVESRIKALSRLVCIVGGWALILLSILVCVEVILRKGFSLSLQGVDEYGGYALAITSAIGLAYTFYEGSHIRIDVLVRLLPRPLRFASSVVALASLLFVAGLFAKYCYLLADESWEIGAFANTPIRTPLYIPQFIWAAGWGLFVIAIAVRIAVIVESVARRQWPALAALLDTHDETLDSPGVRSETDGAQP